MWDEFKRRKRTDQKEALAEMKKLMIKNSALGEEVAAGAERHKRSPKSKWREAARKKKLDGFAAEILKRQTLSTARIDAPVRADVSGPIPVTVVATAASSSSMATAVACRSRASDSDESYVEPCDLGARSDAPLPGEPHPHSDDDVRTLEKPGGSKWRKTFLNM